MRNFARSIITSGLAPQDKALRENDVPDIQLQVRSGSRLMQFRELGATSISHLVRLPGIVISASVLSSRATKLYLTCKSCRHVAYVPVQGGFTGYVLPRKCGS